MTILNAYGLSAQIGFALPELEGAHAWSGAQRATETLPWSPSVLVSIGSSAELRERWSGGRTPPAIARATVEGAAWEVEHGRGGDVLMSHPLARFHVDARATELVCAPADADQPRWRRLLLDSALVTVSLLAGFDALHAGTVVVGGNAVAITGGSGAGKSTLVAELVRRGHWLLADDVTTVTIDARGEPIAYPGPPLANVPTAYRGVLSGEVVLGGAAEDWTVVRRHAFEPAPLRALIALVRSPDVARATLERARSSAAAVLSGLLASGADQRRRARRFELASRIAGGAYVAELRAPLGTSGRELAELVERGVAREGEPAAC